MKSRFVLLFIFVLFSVGLVTYRYPVKAAATAVAARDPMAPSTNYIMEKNHISSPVFAGPIVVQGDYAYVVFKDRFMVLNISDPAHITLIGETSLPANVSQMKAIPEGLYLTIEAVSPDYVYFISSSFIMDVRDPQHPKAHQAPDWAPSLDKLEPYTALNNHYIYKAYTWYCGWWNCYVGVMDVYDVSDPAQIEKVLDFSLGPPAWGSTVYAHGDYLYYGTGSIRIFDTSDMNQIVEIGSYPTSLRPRVSDGSYLAVSGQNMLETIDATNTITQTTIASYDLTNMGDTRYMTLTNGLLYGEFSSNYLAFFSYPSLDLLGSYQTTGKVVKRVMVENRLYTLEDNGEFSVFDTTGGQITLLSQPSFNGDPLLGFDVNGRYIYAVNPLDNALRIWDATDPNNPTLSGELQIPTLYLWQAAVRDPYAYLLEMPMGTDAPSPNGYLHTYNIADPYHLMEVSTYPLATTVNNNPDVTNSLALYDHYLIIANGRANTVEILTLADQSHPTPIYTSANLLPFSANYVEIQGHYAYFGNSEGNLAVVDMSNPLEPILVGQLLGIGSPPFVDMSIQGSNLYFAGGDHLFQIDISNPANLYTSAVLPKIDMIDAEGQYVHVATATGAEIWQTPLTDPPVVVATYSTTVDLPIKDMKVVEDFAYILQPPNLNIFDITDPNDPRLISTHYNIPLYHYNYPNLVQIVGRNIYLSLLDKGWFLYDFDSSYSASGQVLDVYQEPLSGVTISASPNVSTVTDENGYYAFTNLSANRTLTPALAGYTFYPPTQIVPLEPINNGLHFITVPPASQVVYTPNLTATLSYTSVDGRLTELIIPAGAFSMPITLTLTPNVPSNSPYGAVLWARHAFALSAQTLSGQPLPHVSFTSPLILTLRYSDRDFAGVYEESLMLSAYTDTGWQTVHKTCPTAVEPILNTFHNQLTISLCTTGEYALFGPSYQTYIPFTSQHPH